MQGEEAGETEEKQEKRIDRGGKRSESTGNGGSEEEGGTACLEREEKRSEGRGNRDKSN